MTIRLNRRFALDELGRVAVVLDRRNGTILAPNDLVTPTPGDAPITAAAFAIRQIKGRQLSDRALAARFCGQWPGGPQMTS